MDNILLEMKKNVWEACSVIMDSRIKELEIAMQQANQASIDDTKSSAGDKYETTREMVQQDINRIQQQLKIAQQDRQLLNQLDSTQQHSIIRLGTLVQTDSAYYYLSVSIGQVVVGKEKVFAISTQSPIGKLLIHQQTGDTIVFNGKEQKIKALI